MPSAATHYSATLCIVEQAVTHPEQVSAIVTQIIVTRKFGCRLKRYRCLA